MRKTVLQMQYGKETAMQMKIKFCELPCYAKVDTAEGTLAYKVRNNCFHIDKLPTDGLQKEFYSFVMHRAEEITVLSMRSDLAQFNVVLKFLSEKYPAINSLMEIPLDTLIKEMKKWLMKNGKSLTTRRVSKRLGKDEQQENINVRYLKKVYEYLMPEDNRPEREKDIWRLDRLGIDLIDNPILGTATLNFSKIVQNTIKQEVKDAAYMELLTRAVGTVSAELVAVN